MHLFDLGVLILFSLMIYLGLSKGLLKTIFSFVRFGLSAVMTFFFYSQFKEVLIQMTPIDNWIKDYVAKRLVALGGQAAETTVNMVDVEVMKGIPMPQFIRDELLNRLTAGINDQTSSILASLTDMVLSFITIVGMFIVVYLLLLAVFSMIESLSKLPVLNSFNRLGGALVGAVNAYLISSVVVLGMVAVNTMFTIQTFQGALSTSIIYNWLMEYNIFVVLLKLF